MKRKPVTPKRLDIVALEHAIAQIKRAAYELERASKPVHHCTGNSGCKAWDCDNLR